MNVVKLSEIDKKIQEQLISENMTFEVYNADDVEEEPVEIEDYDWKYYIISEDFKPLGYIVVASKNPTSHFLDMFFVMHVKDKEFTIDDPVLQLYRTECAKMGLDFESVVLLNDDNDDNDDKGGLVINNGYIPKVNVFVIRKKINKTRFCDAIIETVTDTVCLFFSSIVMIQSAKLTFFDGSKSEVFSEKKTLYI